MADDRPWIDAYNAKRADDAVKAPGLWEPSPWADERNAESANQTIPSGGVDDGDKPWWRSKTCWYGVCITAMSGLSMFQEQDLIQASPKLVSMVGVCLGLGTILLRFLTSGPIQLPKVIIRGRK